MTRTSCSNAIAPFVQWLKTTGVKHTYQETAGAHTWLVWRDYLEQLFR